MKIAISGAGVAGTALAHWLQRSGHTPVLIEQAPQFRTGGYMIDFWGVGYRVAQRMGIEEQIRDAGYDVNCLRSVGPDGTVKAELDVEVFRRMLGDSYTSLVRRRRRSVLRRRQPSADGPLVTRSCPAHRRCRRMHLAARR